MVIFLVKYMYLERNIIFLNWGHTVWNRLQDVSTQQGKSCSYPCFKRDFTSDNRLVHWKCQ